MASPSPPAPLLTAGSCIAVFSSHGWGPAFGLDPLEHRHVLLQCIVGRVIVDDPPAAQAWGVSQQPSFGVTTAAEVTVAYFRPLGSQGAFWAGQSRYTLSLHRSLCCASAAHLPRPGNRRSPFGWAFCALNDACGALPLLQPAPPAPLPRALPWLAPPALLAPLTLTLVPQQSASVGSSAGGSCGGAVDNRAPPGPLLPNGGAVAAADAAAAPLAAPLVAAAVPPLADPRPASLAAGDSIVLLVELLYPQRLALQHCVVRGPPRHDAAAGTCEAVISHHRPLAPPHADGFKTGWTARGEPCVTLRYDQWAPSLSALPRARGACGPRVLDWAFYDACLAAPEPAAAAPPPPPLPDAAAEPQPEPAWGPLTEEESLAQREQVVQGLEQCVLQEHRQQQLFQQQLQALLRRLPPPPRSAGGPVAGSPAVPQPPPAAGALRPGEPALPGALGSLPFELWELVHRQGPPDTAARLSLTCRAMATLGRHPTAAARALVHRPLSPKRRLLAPFAARPGALPAVLRAALPALVATPFALSRPLLRDVLCVAAAAGLVALVTNLLDTVLTDISDVSPKHDQAPWHYVSVRDDCALEAAVRAAQVETLTLLLNRSGGPFLRGDCNRLGLFSLAAHGCIPAAAPAVIALLLAHCPVGWAEARAEAEDCARLCAARADAPVLLAALLPPAVRCSRMEAGNLKRKRSVRARCAEEAATYGNAAALAACLKGFQPNAQTLSRLVSRAARGWHVACLCALLDKEGAAKGRRVSTHAVAVGATPLHEALQAPGPVGALDTVVELLLERQALVSEHTLRLADQWRGEWWGETGQVHQRLRQRLA